LVTYKTDVTISRTLGDPKNRYQSTRTVVASMRTKLMAVFAVLAVFAVGLAAQLGAFAREEPRLIPLDTVYASFNQDGFKSLDPEVETDGLFRVLGAVRESPQRIVLCIGTDVSSAVKGSEVGFGAPDEAIPPVTDATSESLWLGAYLGSDGSVPPAFRVSAIEVNGKTIRVAYERDASPVRSADLRSYLIWVPIGRLEAGP
jgi:hypothetical protein